MKKNRNKIIAIGIVLSIMSGNSISAFALDDKSQDTTKKASDATSLKAVDTLNYSTINGQTNEVKQIITLDKVIEEAINNSDKLELKEKEISLYINKMRVQDKINDFYDSINQTVYDFPYDKLKLQKKQTEQSKKFLKDQIESDITNKYNAIVMKQMDIEKSKTNLKIKTKELDTMKTKITIGMATANQLEDKQIELKSLQDEINAKDNSLKNNMDYLGILINLDLSKYILDENIKFEVFRINGSLDEYLDDKIDKYLKYNKEMLYITKDYFKDLKDDGIKDVMDDELVQIPDKSKYAKVDENGNPSFDSGSYALSLLDYQQKQQKYLGKLNGYGSYLDGKYSLEEGKIKLDDSKKSLKNGLKESYSTLLDLENKINRLNEQVKSTNTKLRYAKARVDIGMMTENDYKAQILKSEDLDTSLRQLIDTYNNLKNAIQKPWILNSK